MVLSQHTLYLGSYAEATQAGIYAFTFAHESGQLIPTWSFAGIINPSFVVLHPNRRWLFAVSETSAHAEGRSGQVCVLRLPGQEAGNQPHLINQQQGNGDWPCHLTIDASGRWLLVSNYQSGNVSVLPILENGALGGLAENVQHHGHGPDAERQEGPHTHSTLFTPDQRFVIVADLGLDQLVVYAFDVSNGHLNEHTRIHCQPGSGPRHMVFHPNNRQLYVSHELNNTVVVYDYDAASATFTERQTIATIPPGITGNLAAHIQISPAGDWLYVSNRGHNSLATFAVNASGLLAPPIFSSCGGNWPRHFALAPTGDFLFVANQYSNDLSILPLRDEQHIPGEVHARVMIPGASCVQFA